MNIGDKIRQQRRVNGMTQEKLSEQLGISLKTIQRWEAGIRSPRTEEVNKLAEKLNTTTGYLMGLDDKPEKSEEKSLPINSDSDLLEMTYWGGVVDKARKIAKLGNYEDIFDVSQMLKRAVASLDKAAAQAVPV